MKRSGWLLIVAATSILGGCSAPPAVPAATHETASITLSDLADVAISFPSFMEMVGMPAWQKGDQEERKEGIAVWCETYYGSVYLNLDIDPREKLIELIDAKTSQLLDEKDFVSPAKETAEVETVPAS